MGRLGVWLAVGLLLGAGPAGAVTLTLVPTALSIAKGDDVTVSIVVSGLGSEGPDSLRSFDLDLGFDDSILLGTGLTLEPNDYLGSIGGGQALGFSGFAGGVADLRKSSFLSEASLDALQPSSFLLGEVTLQGIAAGISLVSLTQTDLVDATLDADFLIPDGASVLQLSIEVVPEPAAALLLAFALAGLAALRAHGSGPASAVRGALG